MDVMEKELVDCLYPDPGRRKRRENPFIISPFPLSLDEPGRRKRSLTIELAYLRLLSLSGKISPILLLLLLVGCKMR